MSAMGWLNRRMYRKLAQAAALNAVRSRRNQFPERPSNGSLPGSDFWRQEAERYLDEAAAYEEKSSSA